MRWGGLRLCDVKRVVGGNGTIDGELESPHFTLDLHYRSTMLSLEAAMDLFMQMIIALTWRLGEVYVSLAGRCCACKGGCMGTT